MATYAYLHFRGDCAAALDVYRQVFAATDLQLMRYGDAPDGPAAWRGSARILHGQITIGSGARAGTLMASDYPPGIDGDPQQAVSVMQTAEDVAVARSWFDALAGDGEVIAPFAPVFWSPGFGMLRDAFGTHWILAAEP